MSSTPAALRSERGYTLVEMLAVLVIFGTLMGGLMTLFVQGTSAETDMNNRFRAQQQARLALDKVRREAHCATAVTSASQSAVTLSLPSYCGNGSVTWCTVSLGASYTAQSTTALATLSVDFPVNVKPARTVDLYELKDDIVLRNSTRT